ncbi:hypothetical protein HHK36_021168 [Tetracentron sinense]|uniref:Ionotropic glutamate receptor C-terminal domain-containing protein n=1 Tax=Tetracentron sinense TaxID=13715 RepID=A0A835D6U2_TETSI|nr:hypothetical protein HHK36_021168 [Tetracentron sinense]
MYRRVHAQNKTSIVDVGVILDLNTSTGKMSRRCMSMALSDFYATHQHYTTRLVLHIRDSKGNRVDALSAALDLLKNVEVQAIIGPETSAQANFVVDLGDKAQVPIVSFSATSPSLSSEQNSYFIRATQIDSFQVKAISAIVQAFGWREVVPIYEDTDYGNGLVPYLTDAFQEIGTRILNRSFIPDSATDDEILEELKKLKKLKTRVFIVHMLPSLGSRFFLKAKEVGMMNEGYAWIITNELTNLLNFMDPTAIDSMQGVLGLRTYVPRSKHLDKFRVRWRNKLQKENPNYERSDLTIFGLWAYDTVWALAMAVEKVGSTTISFQNPKVAKNSTDIAALGVSRIGPKLLQAILRTRFKGLSGEFNLINGQLQSSVFQLVNVLGNGAREIGFWTPLDGIMRKLNVNSMNKYTTSASNLGGIIWPGESATVPTTWKKLRIGVPVKSGFTEFVKVTPDPITNVPIVTGYSIDVFEAVMKALPYDVPYEFIPFANSDGTSAGTYDEMIQQVYLKNYDAVVGDTTIRFNRSLYVDFTLSYTESGVSMIVPIKDDKSKNAWVFLKPLTMNLWLTSGAFFIFTGFVIWVLEHQINDDFRGPIGHQLGTIFWFSFSTLVFAHSNFSLPPLNFI